MAVILIGTLDTKGRELEFVKERLRGAGLEVLTIDAGTGPGERKGADYGLEEVVRAAGRERDWDSVVGDRGKAVGLAAEGVKELVRRLHEEGRVEGVLGIGGSAGTTIGSAAMRELPVGLPKVLVSTMASGQTRPFLGGSDIVLVPSVADIAGLNRVTRAILGNAADALAGMVEGRRRAGTEGAHGGGKVVAATMFGVTTPCVTRARQLLEEEGCEVIVFHATGVGGQAMEKMIWEGEVDGVLDLTTTELADELVGGVLSAGPDRLKAAGERGVPQVISVGALDMVNFGPIETVPERFRGRKLHVHNAHVTLMRTTAEECAKLGEWIARAVREAKGPVEVLIPRGGVSGLDAPGGAFHDPEADESLFEAIRRGVSEAGRVTERPEHINDPSFAELAADRLLKMMGARRP